jgi:hypothetical protein
MNKKILLIANFVFFIFAKDSSYGLSLSQYLEDVKSRSASYNSAETQFRASTLLQKESELFNAPNFFINGSKDYLRQDQLLSADKYSLDTQTYSFGISKISDFGIETALSYEINRYSYNPTQTSNNLLSIYKINPKIALTIPLWQGFGGSLVKSNKDLIFYNNEYKKLDSLNSSLNSLIEAEKAYWKLVVARKIVAIESEDLKQAKNILDYQTKRLKMNLAEKSDLLQARASYLESQSKLALAKNDEILAAIKFNQQLFINSDKVNEKLDDIDFNSLEKTDNLGQKSSDRPNDRPSDRYDVMAANAGMKSAIAQAKITEETNRPSLNLIGSYDFNGIEKNSPRAISGSLAGHGKEVLVGVKFSLPLYFDTQNQVRQGARLSASAAKTNYQQKLSSQESDWQNLVQNLNYKKQNLKLLKEIELAQKLKLENEQKLLKQGRTTTYQILVFKQNYNKAELDTVNNAYEILSLIADQKLYDNSYLAK